MKNLKAIATSTFALALAAFTMAEEARVVSVQVGRFDATGKWVAGAPKIGEPIAVWTVYNQAQESAGAYTLRVKVANRVREFAIDNFYQGNYDHFTAISAPVDGPIKVEVTVDPDNNLGETPLERTNNTMTAMITPAAPATAVEYFDPKRYLGTLKASIYLKAGAGQRNIAVWTLRPTSETFQKVNSASASASMPGSTWAPMSLATVSPAGDQAYTRSAVYTPSGWSHLSATYDVTVSNVRVNRTILNQATWAQMDALKGINIFAANLVSEPEISTTSSAIKNYVISALGSNYRTTMTPYAAARKMYQRILKDIVYYYADDRPMSADAVLQQGRGDCGGFSQLIQACFRSMGIPTRITMGWWTGGGTHVWNEFWIPGSGWIICDGSIGNGYDETGEYAMCFGNFIDLNSRMINSRSNTHFLGSERRVWLQGTANTGNNYTFGNYSIARDLVPVP